MQWDVLVPQTGDGWGTCFIPGQVDAECEAEALHAARALHGDRATVRPVGARVVPRATWDPLEAPLSDADIAAWLLLDDLG